MNLYFPVQHNQSSDERKKMYLSKLFMLLLSFIQVAVYLTCLYNPSYKIMQTDCTEHSSSSFSKEWNETFRTQRKKQVITAHAFGIVSFSIFLPEHKQITSKTLMYSHLFCSYFTFWNWVTVTNQQDKASKDLQLYSNSRILKTWQVPLPGKFSLIKSALKSSAYDLMYSPIYKSSWPFDHCAAILATARAA